MKKRVLSLLMAFALCMGLAVMAEAEETVPGGAGVAGLTTKDGNLANMIKSYRANVSAVECTHPDVDSDNKCTACGLQMTAKLVSGETAKYFANGYNAQGNTQSGLDAAFANAPTNGGTVTALIGGTVVAYLTGSKDLTLDLNGKSISSITVDDSVPGNTLTITGSGRIDTLLVRANNTVVLTDWTGEISTLGFYKSATLELTDGTFGAINLYSGAKAGDLLASDYAFRTNDGKYVAYTETGALQNVTVVACPHSMITDGTCGYCGKTGIAATLGTEIYDESTLNDAFTDWQTRDGATLTLHQDCSFSANAIWYQVYNGTFDLNGHTLTLKDGAGKGTSIEVKDSSVTIVDSSANGGGKIDNIEVTSGSLTLESGEIGNLKVTSTSARVALKGGSLGGCTVAKGVYLADLLPTGYTLKNNELCLDLYTTGATITPSNGVYEIKPISAVIKATEKAGHMPKGKNLPESILPTVTVDADSGVTDLKIAWYQKDSTASFGYQSIGSIDLSAAGVKTSEQLEDAFVNRMNVGDVLNDVFAVVAAWSDGCIVWMTPITGYTITIDPTDLGEINSELTFTQAADTNGNKGNIADGTFVVLPFGGRADSLSSLTYCFTVSHNGAALTEGKDYEIVSGNTASTAGKHTITIRGLGDYKGTATTTWEIKPYTLSSDFENFNIIKTYDGTTTFNASGLSKLGAFKENTAWCNNRNPWLSAYGGAVTVLLTENDYKIGDITFDSANAGDRTATFTITLTEGGNFVFDGGGRTLHVTEESIYGSINVKIDKAPAPTDVSNGALTVYNQTKRTYEIDLLGLLPKLDSPRNYGAVTGGTVVEVTLSDGYYDKEANGAKIENGKLYLPIESVSSTKAEKIGTVTVTVTTTNYKDMTLTIDVSAANQPSSGGSSSGGSTTTKIETATNPDGSMTKTETKSDGTVIETTTNPDGSVSKTESKTTTKSNGATVETVTETNTGADGSKSTSKTETTTNRDGSKTETKSETKTSADGTKSETKSETKTDANGVTSGTETTKTTAPNGSTGTTTTTTENGNSKTEAEAKVSEKAVEDAKKSGEAVKVPTEVKAGENSDSAPTVKVELPKNAGETKIEIPVEDVNSGTVAVIVHEDGTEKIVKDSVPTKDGVQLIVDGSATVKIIDNSKNFRDTRDHWSRDEVNFVASREIFNGVGGNNFGVDQPMTRGMVNTVLARLAGVDTTPSAGQKWYEVGTAWAKANGISDGTNPEASVTREQLATLLYRFSGTPEVNGNLLFNDAHEVSDYAQNALLWATQSGILNGVGSGRVAPGADAQRAQVAAMMARYLKNAG